MTLFRPRMKQVNSLFQERETFTQVGRRFRFQDQLNFLREIGDFVHPSAMAMRLRDPIVLMATGKVDVFPSTIGFSNSSAFPPPGDFISRSAHSAMTRSVSTCTVMRCSSPACSSCLDENPEMNGKPSQANVRSDSAGRNQ